MASPRTWHSASHRLQSANLAFFTQSAGDTGTFWTLEGQSPRDVSSVSFFRSEPPQNKQTRMAHNLILCPLLIELRLRHKESKQHIPCLLKNIESRNPFFQYLIVLLLACKLTKNAAGMNYVSTIVRYLLSLVPKSAKVRQM